MHDQSASLEPSGNNGHTTERAFLNVREVAQYLGFSPKTVLGFIRSGRLAHKCFSRKTYSIARTELHRFVQEADTGSVQRNRSGKLKRKTKRSPLSPPSEPQEGPVQ